jgi:predicted NUDIX family phosphoesterase
MRGLFRRQMFIQFDSTTFNGFLCTERPHFIPFLPPSIYLRVYTRTDREKDTVGEERKVNGVNEVLLFLSLTFKCG